MKKLSSLLALVVIMFAGLDSQAQIVKNTPNAIAEYALGCLLDGNYKGFISRMYEVGDLDASQETALEVAVEEMEEANPLSEFDALGGVDKVEILEEAIEGEKAVVLYEYHFGNGTTLKDILAFKKSPSGNWLITTNDTLFDTPEEVVDKAIQCAASGDYRGFISYVVEDATNEAEQAQIDKMVEIVGGIFDAEMKRVGGIKSYSIVEKNISDDKASIKVSYLYNNGEKDYDSFNLGKQKSGKWLILME